MGLSVDEQKKAQSIRRQPPNIAIVENRASGCCQGNGNLSCCQNATIMAKPVANHPSGGTESNPSSSSKSAGRNENFMIPTWLKQPVQDTYAVVAIVAAIASVAGAYLYYRN